MGQGTSLADATSPVGTLCSGSSPLPTPWGHAGSQDRPEQGTSMQGEPGFLDQTLSSWPPGYGCGGREGGPSRGSGRGTRCPEPCTQQTLHHCQCPGQEGASTTLPARATPRSSVTMPNSARGLPGTRSGMLLSAHSPRANCRASSAQSRPRQSLGLDMGPEPPSRGWHIPHAKPGSPSSQARACPSMEDSDFLIVRSRKAFAVTHIPGRRGCRFQGKLRSCHWALPGARPPAWEGAADSPSAHPLLRLASSPAPRRRAPSQDPDPGTGRFSRSCLRGTGGRGGSHELGSLVRSPRRGLGQGPSGGSRTAPGGAATELVEDPGGAPPSPSPGGQARHVAGTPARGPSPGACARPRRAAPGPT